MKRKFNIFIVWANEDWGPFQNAKLPSLPFEWSQFPELLWFLSRLSVCITILVVLITVAHELKSYWLSSEQSHYTSLLPDEKVRISLYNVIGSTARKILLSASRAHFNFIWTFTCFAPLKGAMPCVFLCHAVKIQIKSKLITFLVQKMVLECQKLRKIWCEFLKGEQQITSL